MATTFRACSRGELFSHIQNRSECLIGRSGRMWPSAFTTLPPSRQPCSGPEVMVESEFEVDVIKHQSTIQPSLMRRSTLVGAGLGVPL